MEAGDVILEGKRVLITGGTGSLGKALVRRLLGGEMGRPTKIIVFSRDEAKQHEMRLEYLQRWTATDEIIYQNSKELLAFRIGDIRDASSLSRAIRAADVVFNAAAMKQVPTCEYFPFEAVQTNIVGAQNLVRVIRENETPPELVVGVSTDKACKPINVMGMTKAVQERILVQANLECPRTRFVCVRYGNVIASRGSVVPLFLDQIREGGPVTITLKEMTRFLLSLDQAVDTIFAATKGALPGETYVPKVASARVVDIAEAMINGRNLSVVYTGIRPGEKIHEVLVSEEECHRTIEREGYFVIYPILPELRRAPLGQLALKREYSSEHVTLDSAELRTLLAPYIESELKRIRA
jgi:FlaA1/EpsC-like NDP-sugar epimerase